jgi:hypothetical protein
MSSASRFLLLATLVGFVALAAIASARADGKMFAPRNYKGSLEEQAQEAIIVFHGSETPGEATEDLILKVTVKGDVENFAWVIPFPAETKVLKEDARLFKELFDYVQARSYRPKGKFDGVKSEEKKAADGRGGVDVLSRKIVGSYDVAVVRENVAGALNDWLKKEGYQELGDAEDVIGFYREKRYVFACIKVAAAELATSKTIDLHPLRFTFKPGGRDGIYFPMKMTGLQSEPFNVNLYVFYRYWLNDELSKFGYVHRGFHLKYRDWDSPDCEPNGGKAYSSPRSDPFLRDQAPLLTNISQLFQKLHPGERYYLTNIQAFQLKPADVRHWSDDLWLFPYYTNKRMVPYDARRGGPASAAWPDEEGSLDDDESDESAATIAGQPWYHFAAGAGLLVLAAVVAVWFVLSRPKRA